MRFFWIIPILLGFTVVPFFGSVSSNPFLRPGSQQKPPPPPKPLPPTSFQKSNAEKEVEFRGYYLLNGVPFFCIFNKKTGHAEWLAISESTFDSYLIQQFDQESEKLTISFDGHSFSLSLMDSKSGGGNNPSSNIAPNNSSPPSGSSGAAKQVTRFMPPRPKTTPSLPSWLVNKRSNAGGVPNSAQAQPTSSPAYSGAVPRRTVSGPFFPGSAGRIDSPTPTASTPGQSLGSTTNRVSDPSSVAVGQSASPQNAGTSSVSAVNQVLNENAGTTDSENAISLDDLPPPPPPPNILPPSPPPDIQPSRDE